MSKKRVFLTVVVLIVVCWQFGSLYAKEINNINVKSAEQESTSVSPKSSQSLNNSNYHRQIPPGQIIQCRFDKAYPADKKGEKIVELVPLNNAHLKSHFFYGEAIEDKDTHRVYIRCKKMINKQTGIETLINAYVADENNFEGTAGDFFDLLDESSLTDPKKPRVLQVIFLSRAEIN